MSAWTDAVENGSLNFCFRGTAIPIASPATVYVGMFTTQPFDAGTGGVEVSAGNYARVAMAFDAPVLGVTQNTGIVTFPAPNATWGTLSGFGIFDALPLGTGNLLFFGPLTNSPAVAPVSGDTVRWNAGANVITADQVGGNQTDRYEGNDASTGMINYWLRGIAAALNQSDAVNVYLSLHSTASTDAAAGTEFTAALSPGYTRATVVRNTTIFGAASAGTIINSVLAIAWPVATGAWQTIVSVEVYDALTGGARLFYVSPSNPPSVASTQTLQIAINNFSLTID